MKNDTHRWLRARPGLARLLALVLSSALAIGLGEVVLRVAEATLLSGELKIGRDSVDLAGMNFNDSRVRRSRAPGQFRVLSFGDSFAQTTVKYPYSHHAIAGERLDLLGLGQRFRVVNLGEPAISFYQYVDRYRFWSEIIEHDGVLFDVYLGNDILEVALGHVADEEELNRLFMGMDIDAQTGVPRMKIPRRYWLRMIDYSVALFKVLEGDIKPVQASRGDKYTIVAADLSEKAYYGSALSQLDNFDARRLSGLRRGYEAMIRFLRYVSEIRATGKPVAIFLSPSETQASPVLRAELERRFGVDPESYDLGLPAFLIREARRRIDSEIPMLDLTRAFAQGEKNGQDLYLGTNTHWSADGDALAGRCLADFLARSWFERTDLPIDPACPTGDSEPVARELRLARERAVADYLLPLLDGRAGEGAAAARSPVAGLSRLEGSTTFAITTVNGADFDALGEEKTVPRKPRFSLSGWAIDSLAMSAAGGVVVEVNGVDHVAQYGMSRSDVALHFDDWNLHAVGYSLLLPPEATRGSASLTLRLKVVSGDGRGYYESGPIELHFE